jgi:MerR family mercuric resistance operon transcriptional regulator
MKISKFAKSVDISVETVRYYHREGLLSLPPSDIGIRQYNQSHIDQILFIKNAKLAGFSLKEIKRLNTYDAVNDRQTILALSEQKKKRLQTKIQELKGAMVFLQTLVNECKTSKDKSCPILEGLKGSH